MFKIINPRGETIEVQSPFGVDGEVYVLGPNYTIIKQTLTTNSIVGITLEDHEYLGPFIIADIHNGTVEIQDGGFGIYVYSSLKTN